MQNAFIQLDAHVHLYPQCDLPLAVRYSLENMRAYSQGISDQSTVRIWLLTERADCHQYKWLAQQRQIGDYKIEATSEKKALALIHRGQTVLYIMPGRQIVTREGLELCALITFHQLYDRQFSARDAIKLLQEAGAVVALNWAPGKWFFNRGRVVDHLIDATADCLFIGDTTMRPTVWPTPRLMRRALRNGWRLLYGSDPLPFKGEERMFGSYGTLLNGPFSLEQPATSLLKLLKNPTIHLTAFGRRSNPAQFVWRQWRIMAEKKNRQ